MPTYRRSPGMLCLLAVLAVATQNLIAGTITTVSASAALPNPSSTGEPVAFTASAADSEGLALSYTWDFGDGSTGSGESPVHVYAAAGTFTATLTVSNGTVSSIETVPVNVVETTDTAAASSFQIQLLLLEIENAREALSKAGLRVIANDKAGADSNMNDALAIAQRLSEDAAIPATAPAFGKKSKSVQSAFLKLVKTTDASRQKMAAFDLTTLSTEKKIQPLKTVTKSLSKIDKLIIKNGPFLGGVVTTIGGFQHVGDIVKLHVQLAANATGATVMVVSSGAAGTNIATAVLPDPITTGDYVVTMGPDQGAVSFTLFVGGKRWGGVVLNNYGTASGAALKPGTTAFDGEYSFIATVKQSFESFNFGFMITGTATVTNGILNINSKSLPPINTRVSDDGNVSFFFGSNLTYDRIEFKGKFGADGIKDGTFNGTGHGNYTGQTTSQGTFSGTWTALKF